MKNLKELKGVKVLNKKEQKSILGGLACVTNGGDPECPGGTFCCHEGNWEGMCREEGTSCYR
ncbi:MAG: hypothetical protein EHM93_06325 [Bacteroidales bacterium]|nr:MAG: hypothetical protein EHM93_06325 [Bacteroidales bacterium]